MIALDTNILARFLLNDSPSETAIARRLLLGTERCTAPITVLLELIWVLESQKFNRPPIAAAIHLLDQLDNFSFEQAHAMSAALQSYENGMDFADGLHLAMSTSHTELRTFDKAFFKSAKKLGAWPPVTIPT